MEEYRQMIEPYVIGAAKNTLTEEQLGEFRQAFSMYDLNADGSIDVNELDGVFRAVGKPLLPQELEKIIAKHDIDQNGQISFKEFTAMFANL
jgi:calmodulin